MSSSLKALIAGKTTRDQNTVAYILLDIIGEVIGRPPNHNTSDRGLALVCASAVDEMLEIAILTKMRPLSKTDHDSLFAGDTPLATFSAKIKMGYALNFYGPMIRSDMNRLREIRNVFSHSRSDISFKTKEISDECAKFKFHKVAPQLPLTNQPKDAKELYGQTAALFIFVLMRIIHPETDLGKQWTNELILS